MVAQISAEVEEYLGNYKTGADVFGFDETLSEMISDAVGSKAKAEKIIKGVAKEAATMAVYYRDHSPRKDKP